MRRLAALFAALLSSALVVLALPVMTGGPPAGATTPAPQGVVPGPWHLTPTSGPTGNEVGSSYWGDSCVGPMFCMTVGDSYDRTADTDVPLGATWNGSTWTSITTFSPSTPTYAGFYGVSCVTTSWCMAAGWAKNGSDDYVPLAELWNGSSWTLLTSPDPVVLDTEFYSVSCTSTTFCELGGFEDITAPWSVALLEQWNGSTLTVQSPPSGLDEDSYVESVSCIAKWCMAVGSTGTGYPNFGPMALQFNGSSWAISPVAPGSGTGQLFGVSCPTTTMCMAAGVQSEQTVNTNLVEQWNGKTNTWSVESTPVGNATYGDWFEAVSCAGPVSCVAGGWVDTSAVNFDNEIEAWNGKTWVLETMPTLTTVGNEVNGLACVSNDVCMGVGYQGDGSFTYDVEALDATIHRPGYSEVAADGGFFNFGGAPFYGSIGGHPLNAPVVGMAMTPDGGGYWEVASDGGIFAFGDAGYYGSEGGKPLNKPIVGMVPTLDGRGYWLVASDGGVFTFGDATFYGSMGGKPLNKPIVGIALAPSGLGYYEVASDGGLFAFGLPGQAPFLGSTGNITLNSPIVGMAVTAAGGYYEVASDGGLFAFGGIDKAPFKGSMGGKPLNKPIVGMAVDPAGGYYEVASDGGIFTFGGPTFAGSMGGKTLVEPIVGIAT